MSLGMKGVRDSERRSGPRHVVNLLRTCIANCNERRPPVYRRRDKKSNPGKNRYVARATRERGDLWRRSSDGARPTERKRPSDAVRALCNRDRRR